MANLENNNDKENKSVTEKIGNSVQKRVDKVQDTVKDAAELAADAVTKPVETAKEFTKQAAKDVTNYKWWAKLLLVIFWSGLALFAAILIAINLDVTKQWAAKQALQVLNQDFKAKMTTESITVDYFGDVQVKGLKIEDYKGLEFIKAKEFRANSDWLKLAANAISKRNNALSFNSLQLIEADVKVITYKGDSISNFIRYTKNFNTGKKSDPNKPPFEMNSRVELVNSKLSIINQNHDGDAGKWLQATNVNLVVPTLKVAGSKVFAQINNFSFVTERWGKKHLVDTFSADVSYTDKFLQIKDLTFNTDHSLLQGNIKFNLNNGSWADFTNRVRWEMDLKTGSQLSGYDISYFVTKWDNYRAFDISGKMTGPLNKFYLEDFILKNPQVSIATGTMRIDNLLNKNIYLETSNLSTNFTYRNLKAMLPSFISIKMKNFADDFGRMKYNGALKFTTKQIYIPHGSIIAGIGQAKVQNFSLSDYSTKLPKYKGFIEARDLNIAAITHKNQVGLISGDFNLEGQSFDVNSMRLRTKSTIHKIQITGKEINNLYLDGILDHKKYFGIVNVNDEQAKAGIKGLIDFSTRNYKADITADISHLNINYFTGKPGQQLVSGFVKGKISMTDLNDLNLDADISNLAFTSGLKKYLIPKASVKTYFESGNRIIAVNSPGAVNGKIAGNYKLADLGGMTQNGIQKVLVGPPPRKLYRGESFNMQFDVQQGLVAYFLPKLEIPHGALINGSYDGSSNNLVLNADVASLKYMMENRQEITDADRALAKANPAYKIGDQNRVTKDSAMVDNLILRINTANLQEQIFAKIDRAQVSKNIFRGVTLSGRNENNQILHLAANFKHGSPEDELADAMKDYAINLNQTTDKAGNYVVRFEPTTVKYNDVAWTIDTSPELNHSITYRKISGDFLVQNFRIFSDDSSLFVKNGRYKSAKDFDVDAEIQNLQLDKIMAMQAGGNPSNIKGIANGTVKIRMNENNLEPIIDLNVNNIVMNAKKMGDIVISAKNGTSRNIFDIEAKVINSEIIGNNSLVVSGTVNNNTASPTLDLSADMNDFDLAFANQFVKNVFSNMRGKANGVLKISGTMKDLDYHGDIALKGFGMKLNFTGVDYSMEDTVIKLSRGLAVLNNIGLKDGRPNSSGTISGSIFFETLSSMGLELVLDANNLMVLNSTQKDNDLFWGRVFGKGALYVSGPVSALNIETSHKDPFRALNNSSFTFNSNSTSNVEEFKMLRFLKEDKGAIVVEKKKNSGANMNIDFNLAVDKGTTVNVLVGDDVGDISVRGVADNLHFKMARSGGISIDGNYLVDNGTFVSKAILNRTFQIARGSSINWDGNAMAPTLDITATYVRTVSNTGQYLNLNTTQPVNILLSTKISQTLNNPKIDLGVSALDASSQLNETLAAKMSQQEEKVMQFGSILVLNSFNVNNEFNLNVGAVAQNSGYNLLFKQLGSVLNNISNEFQFDLDYVSGDANSNTSDRANAGMSFAISPRVKVKTGLGVPLSKNGGTAATADKNMLSGEGTVEMDVSKKNDGTFVVRGYSKPMNIGMSAASSVGANQAYGVGVVWSKSFNTILKRKKNTDKNSKEKTKTPAPDAKKDTVK